MGPVLGLLFGSCSHGVFFASHYLHKLRANGAATASSFLQFRNPSLLIEPTPIMKTETEIIPTVEENKSIYRRYLQAVFNEGRLDQLSELLDPAYVYRDAPPGTPPGAEGIKQVVSMFRSAFPDLKITIEDQIAEGDKVCSRAITRGTHRGEIFGIPPTGKSVLMRGITIVRVVNGRIAESWVSNDVMGLMNQLRSGAPK